MAPQSTGTNGPARAAAAAVNAAGDQLLARARLAHDQHVDVGVGHLLDRVEHLAHGRAAADHVVEAVGPLDLPAQQFVLGFQPPAAQQPAGAVRQHLRIDRLGQVVARAQAQAGGGRFQVRPGRDHDHRQLGIDLASRATTDRPCVVVRAIDVDDQQIERFRRATARWPLRRTRPRRIRAVPGPPRQRDTARRRRASASTIRMRAFFMTVLETLRFSGMLKHCTHVTRSRERGPPESLHTVSFSQKPA